MLLKNFFFLILAIALVTALTGCRKIKHVAYYHTLHPDPSGWRTDTPLVFTADSVTAPGLEAGQYKLYLVTRYRESFNQQKLYLRLEFTSLMHGVRTKEMMIDIDHPAANSGAQVKLNRGLIELMIPLGYDYVDQGWTLSVQQRMAPPPIVGINDIGIKMVKE